jgi:FkbM family methyltransferase
MPSNMNLGRLKQNKILRVLFYPYIAIKLIFIRRSERKFESDFQRFMGNVVDPLCIRISDYKGDFELGSDSNILRMVLEEGTYEKELISVVQSCIQPNRDVLDVGANVGLFSVLFSKSLEEGRKVLSVEPSDAAFSRLERNIRRNNCSNNILHKGALGSEISKVQLHSVEGKEEYSSLKPIAHKHASDLEQISSEVSMIPLDNLVREHGLNPAFMKMDVEGAEFEVLKGATETLKTFKPTILAELDNKLLSSFGTNAEEVVRFLNEFGYKVVDARTGGTPVGGFGDSILATPQS